MAPERFSPAGYDVRSDLWSLGVSLFELACQRSPFGDEHSNEFDFLIAVTTQGESPQIPETAGYSANLVAFVYSCMVKNVNERSTFDTSREGVQPLIQSTPFYHAHVDSTYNFLGWYQSFTPTPQ